jgi:hypothetical protein
MMMMMSELNCKRDTRRKKLREQPREEETKLAFNDWSAIGANQPVIGSIIPSRSGPLPPPCPSWSPTLFLLNCDELCKRTNRVCHRRATRLHRLSAL